MPEPEDLIQTFLAQTRYPFRCVRNRWYFQERETWLWDHRTRRLVGEIGRIMGFRGAQAYRFIPILAQVLTCDDPKLEARIIQQGDNL